LIGTTSERRGDQQDEEREQKHECDHVWQPMLHLAGEVDILRGIAGDGDLDARNVTDRPWDEVIAQHGESPLARSVVAEPSQGQLERRGTAIAASGHRERRMRDPARECLRFQLPCRPLSRGPLAGRPGEGDDRGRRRAGELVRDPRLL
jgi:hypothetical protein